MCLTIFLTILRKINIDLRLDLKFVTEPYTAQGICRVLRYEGGGGGSKKPKSALRNLRKFPNRLTC
jgi:hypothetical protein